MPKGEKLTKEHQSRSAMQNIAPRLPRGAKQEVGPPPPPDAPEDAKATYEQELSAATLRLQKARADTEELDAQKRQVELDVLKRKLVPVPETVDALERLHLAWVAELEQLSTAVCQSLRHLPGDTIERVREAVNAEVHAIRNRIADA